MKGITPMAYKDNEIDISDLKNVTLNVGDLRAIITLFECSVDHLLLPDEATVALGRLATKVLDHNYDRHKR
jgi:hypothetical protein